MSAGTGTAARVPGVRVAGKTGTAQNPHGQDHALFVCYAPVDAPRDRDGDRGREQRARRQRRRAARRARAAAAVPARLAAAAARGRRARDSARRPRRTRGWSMATRPRLRLPAARLAAAAGGPRRWWSSGCSRSTAPPRSRARTRACGRGSWLWAGDRARRGLGRGRRSTTASTTRWPGRSTRSRSCCSSLVLVMGSSAMGAKRWLDLGPLQFQPSELAKIATVLVLARRFDEPKLDLRRFAHWFPPLLIALVPFALVAKEPDLGTSLVVPGHPDRDVLLGRHAARASCCSGSRRCSTWRCSSSPARCGGSAGCSPRCWRVVRPRAADAARAAGAERRRGAARCRTCGTTCTTTRSGASRRS